MLAQFEDESREVLVPSLWWPLRCTNTSRTKNQREYIMPKNLDRLRKQLHMKRNNAITIIAQDLTRNLNCSNSKYHTALQSNLYRKSHFKCNLNCFNLKHFQVPAVVPTSNHPNKMFQNQIHLTCNPVRYARFLYTPHCYIEAVWALSVWDYMFNIKK